MYKWFQPPAGENTEPKYSFKKWKKAVSPQITSYSFSLPKKFIVGASFIVN